MEKRNLSGLQLQAPRRWLPLWPQPWATRLGYRVVRIIAYSVLFWLVANLAAITKGVTKEVPWQ